MAAPSKIDAVLVELTNQGKQIVATQEWQKTTHERIFGGQQPGILQYLHIADEKLAETITKSNKELVDALTTFKTSVDKQFTDVKADVTELKTEKRVHKAYIAGGVAAGSMMGWLIKAGALKLGIHIP